MDYKERIDKMHKLREFNSTGLYKMADDIATDLEDLIEACLAAGLQVTYGEFVLRNGEKRRFRVDPKTNVKEI